MRFSQKRGRHRITCRERKLIEKQEQSGSALRIFILQFAFAVLLLLLLYRLWDLQIVNGEKYVQDYELKITRTIRDKNTRGSIYDCNGKILAYNELSYVITMIDDGVYTSERQRQLTLNSMIYRVVKKLEENQELLNNELKIAVGTDQRYAYMVSGTALTRFKADIFGKADPEDMTLEQREMSADMLVEHLSSNSKFALYGEGKRDYTNEERQEYGLPQTFTAKEILAVLGIRYMLSLNE